jgi:CHASE3 domain sensor protein
MARTSRLGRTLGIVSAVALVVTACALVVAVLAAASGTAQRRELSQRLLPAASAADTMASLFTEEQASLRQYVATGRAATLGPFRQAAALIPGQEARVGALGSRYSRVEGQLDTVVSALGAWRARFAGPELAAGARGDFTRARAIQDDDALARHYSLPARRGIAALQGQLTQVQEQVTARLATDQVSLLAALLAAAPPGRAAGRRTAVAARSSCSSRTRRACGS